jgi:Putative beta-barrel porin-2, OmpL-like. bbp2
MKSARKRIGLGIGLCAIASLLGSNSVFGQTTPATTERVAALEQRTNELEKKTLSDSCRTTDPKCITDSQGIWNALGFQISGTVLASYTQNFGNPQTNNNQLRIFDTNANSFMANMAQIVFERPANASGSGFDRAGFRSRINFGADSRFSRARTNFQPGTDNNELDVQELYGEYIAPIGNGLKIQAGKINTLIGYETINAWENPNFSRSFMFGLSQAFTTTGIRFTYPFSKYATATIGLINGWDNIDDNNRGKSFEYLLALTPHEKFGVSVYGSYGAEQSNGNANLGVSTVSGSGGCAAYTTGCDPTAKRTVVGGIITVKPTSRDTIILEPYYGNEGNASLDAGNTNNNARWNGIIAYVTHDFNDQQEPNAFSLRVRGELFEDAGGARTCSGGVNFAGGTNTCATSGSGQAGSSAFLVTNPGAAHVNGQAQTLWEGTFTLQYKPVPQLQTRMEFRYDKSDQNVFLRGSEAVNNQQTLAFSVAYMW